MNPPTWGDNPMHHPDDIWQPDGSRFGGRRRRGSPGLAVAVIAVLAIALIGAGAGWYWLRSRTEPEPPAASAASPTDSAPASAAANVPPLDLPELDASDAFVRDLIAGLSSHPELAAWLVNDGLVQRFVAAVTNIADGASPTAHLGFMGPEAEFSVDSSEARTVIDPASYSRYDLVAETFVSLDTQGAARLYHQLEPLFDEAYRELGFPDGSFNDVLTRAMRNLIAVEVPAQPPELVPSPTIATAYEFKDSALEDRTPAQKQLLRMGPENARRVQEKLGELLPLISR